MANHSVDVTGLVLSVHTLEDGTHSVLWRTVSGTWRMYVAPHTSSPSFSPGRFWHCKGVSEHHPLYGEWLRVTDGKRCMPTGAQTVPYLCLHVPGLVEYRASRWLALWPDNLHEVLSQRNVAALASTLGGPAAEYLAQQAVTLWEKHGLQIGIADYIGPLDGADELAMQIVEYFGGTAYDRLADNPYVLLAFSSFHVIDQIARRHGVTRSDSRRLRGAVEAAVLRLETNEVRAISGPDLTREVSHLLKTTYDDANVAIQQASLSGVVVALDDGYWLGESTARTIVFVAQKLGELCPSPHKLCEGPAPVSGRDLLDYKISRVVITDHSEREQFLFELFAKAQLRGASVSLIAGSTSLARRLKNSFECEVLDSTSNLAANDVLNGMLPRIVVWASSTQCIYAFARVLATLSDIDRLVILEESSPYVAQGPVAHLLTCYGVKAHARPASACATPEVDRVPNSLHQLPPYDARKPTATGLFVLRIPPALREQGMIGLCNQQAANGSVVLILPHDEARRSFNSNWKRQMAEVDALERESNVAIAQINELEPGDASTVVYAVPRDNHRQADLRQLSRIACYRVIIVADDNQELGATSNTAINESAIAALCRRLLVERRLAH